MKTFLFISIHLIACIFLSSLNYKELFPEQKNTESYANTIIQSPVNYFPATGSLINTDSCVFSWSGTGQKHVYEIIIAKNTDFSDGKRFSSKDTSITIDLSELTENLTYYWKVRAFKSKDLHSDWSAASFFYYKMIPEVSPGCHGNCANCTHPCRRPRINKINTVE